MFDLITSNIGHLANIRTLSYMDLPNADTMHHTASETTFIVKFQDAVKFPKTLIFTGKFSYH